MSLVSCIHEIESSRNQMIPEGKNGGMVKLLLYWWKCR